MLKYTLRVEGMMCGMCEAHINDAIRNHFQVKKVTSSHVKSECVILCENEIDEGKIKKVISDTGYTLTDISKSNYEKKGLFSRFKK